MLETQRLILRPMELVDADFVLKLLNTKSWIENIGYRKVHSIEAAKTYIHEKMIAHYLKFGFGNYLMIRKSDAEKIGCTSLYNREELEGTDIGFAMLPEFMEQGYAYEAANAIANYAATTLRLNSITAITIKTNIASQKLLEKLGLRFVKMIEWEETKEELMFYEKIF